MLDMALDVSVKTKAESVRAVLADEIVAGRLTPGSKLDEVQLASRFSISRTPVREAIKQLHAMGLVEHLPHRGARVLGVQVAQLMETYGLVLAGCVEVSMARMDEDGRRRVELAATEADAFAMMVSVLRNPTLAELLMSLEARARPYLGGGLPLRKAVSTGRARKAADLLRQAVADACRNAGKG